jgi:hypothetical protein
LLRSPVVVGQRDVEGVLTRHKAHRPVMAARGGVGVIVTAVVGAPMLVPSAPAVRNRVMPPGALADPKDRRHDVQLPRVRVGRAALGAPVGGAEGDSAPEGAARGVACSGAVDRRLDRRQAQLRFGVMITLESSAPLLPPWPTLMARKELLPVSRRQDSA